MLKLNEWTADLLIISVLELAKCVEKARAFRTCYYLFQVFKLFAKAHSIETLRYFFSSFI